MNFILRLKTKSSQDTLYLFLSFFLICIGVIYTICVNPMGKSTAQTCLNIIKNAFVAVDVVKNDDDCSSADLFLPNHLTIYQKVSNLEVR